MVAAGLRKRGDAKNTTERSVGHVDGVAPPGTTRSASPTPAACSAAPPAAAGGTLHGLGATLADWNANHDADPDHPGWYLPGATDAPDRYTNVMCTADGHVTSYLMNFKPPLTPDAADQAVTAELPSDALRTSVTSASNCTVRAFISGALGASLTAADRDGTATAVLRSITGSDGSVQVYSITISAGPPSKSC